MDYQKLVDLCKGNKVWVQTHNFPDPDAIASAFGLQHFLKEYGVEASICHEGEIDKLSSKKMLQLLGIEMHSYHEIENTMKPEDIIVLVDCQKESGNTTDFAGDEKAAIDHHPTFKKIEYEYADLRITGSCATLIAEYYKEAGLTPSREVATALMYGMRMDTLQLSRGVTSLDIDMYGYLFQYADSKLLSELESNNMEFGDLMSYGTAIKNIKVFGKLGFSFLNFPCNDAMVAILSDFLLSLAEVEVVVIFAQRKGGFKFSFRSERNDVHAGELANKTLAAWGNGGGHASMAGGFAKRDRIPAEDEYIDSYIVENVVDVIKKEYPQVL